MKKKNPFYHEYMADMIVCNSCDRGFETYNENGDERSKEVIKQMKKDFVHAPDCPWAKNHE